MTRTWFKLPKKPVFAVAGIRRDTNEWGPTYSMVMTDACIHVADVHDRMPVILRREEWSDWLDGPPDDARLPCRLYPDVMMVNRTQKAGCVARWTAKSVGCFYEAGAQADVPAGHDD